MDRHYYYPYSQVRELKHRNECHSLASSRADSETGFGEKTEKQKKEKASAKTKYNGLLGYPSGKNIH